MLGKTAKGKVNNVRSALKALSTWAKKRMPNVISEPWTEGVDPYMSKGGHKPWAEEQCRAAEAKFAGWLRRAYFLGLVIGQRGSDVIRIGFADVHDGNLIHVVQEKTKAECWCPIEEPLAAEMRTWDKRPGPFVYQADGTPITKAALDVAFNRIRDKMPELEGTTWHGLRANRVVELRRRGLTTLQIQDLVGMSLKMVERYCRFADKKANAEATIIQM
jgi:hypothetical protein